MVPLAMVFFATSALAGTQSHGSDQHHKDLPSFKKADNNDDGSLTYSEVKDLGVSKKAFKREDLNNDGKLSKYDYKYGLK